MRQFGDFVATRLLPGQKLDGQGAVVYLARRQQAPATENYSPIYSLSRKHERYIVKILEAEDRNGTEHLSHGGRRALLDDNLLAFWGAAEQQKKACDAGGRNLAPVYDFGFYPDGCWYVTDYYRRHDLEHWLEHHLSPVTDAELRNVVRCIVTGLTSLKRQRGCSHGSLHPSKIWVGGTERMPLSETPLFVADPLPGTDAEATAYELADLRALGEIIYRLVLAHGRPGVFDPTHWPIPPSSEWHLLGNRGRYWRELCNRLLDPNLSTDTIHLESLAGELGVRPRAPQTSSTILMAIVALALAAVPVWLLSQHRGGHRTNTTSALGAPAVSSAPAPGQAPPIIPADAVPLSGPTPVNPKVATIPSEEPPTISQIPDQIAPPNRLIGPLHFYVSDPQTPPEHLAVLRDSSNTDLVPNDNIVLSGLDTNRTVMVIPILNHTGRSRITLRVRNGQASAETSFLVTVQGPNTPPTISAFADQVSEMNKSIGPLKFTVFDAETAPEQLTVKAYSSQPALVPNQNIEIEGSSSNRTIRIVPAPDRTGTAQVSVVVDDGSLSSTDSFRVMVKAPPPPAPPPFVSRIHDLLIEPNQSTGPIPFAIGDRQLDAAKLTIGKRSSNPTLLPESNIVVSGQGSNRTVTVTPVKDRTGRARVVLIVGNDQAHTESSFTVEVRQINTPPFVSRIANQTIEQGTSTGPLAFTVWDKETAVGNLKVTTHSSVPELVPQANIVLGGVGSNRTVRVTPAPEATGNARIGLTVSDGALTATSSFRLTVKARVRQPPYISDINGETNLLVARSAPPLRFSFTVDPATPPANLTLEAGSSDTNFLPNSSLIVRSDGTNGMLTIEPVPSQPGSATVVLRVSDGITDAYSAPLQLNIMPPLGLDNLVGMDLVWVPELPGGGRWKGRKSKGGWVGKYPVTQEEYELLMSKNPSYFQKKRAEENGWTWDPRLPVESVNWFEAKQFCGDLTVLERKAGRLPKHWHYDLPTHAQWEYFVGDALTSESLAVTGASHPARVGTKGANHFGLCDTRGNVSEWILDKHNNENPEYTRGAFDSRYLAVDPPYFFQNRDGADGAPNVGFRVVVVPDGK